MKELAAALVLQFNAHQLRFPDWSAYGRQQPSGGFLQRRRIGRNSVRNAMRDDESVLGGNSNTARCYNAADVLGALRGARSRSALVITETELRAIAALAIIGLRTMPNVGYSTPAATGTPMKL